MNSIDLLTAELREFCESHNLDPESSDDLLRKPLPPGQRRWLLDFESRWDAAVELAPLAARALESPSDTEERERAHNAFYDAVEEFMTNDQRREWDDASLKAAAMSDAIIEDAFRILGIPLKSKSDAEGR